MLQVKTYWIHVLIFLLLVARVSAFNRTRASSDYGSADASAILEVFLIALGGLLVVCGRRRNDTLGAIYRSPAIFLLLFYALATISSIWSLHPLYTMVRASEMLLLVVICMSFTLNAKFEQHISNLLIAFICLFIVMHLRNSNFAFTLHSFHTNSYSAIAAAGFVFNYALGIKTRKFDLRYLFIFAFFIILGTSSASILSLLIGLLFVHIAAGSRGIGVLLLTVIPLIFTFLVFDLQSLVFKMIFPGKTMEQVIELRGRADMWSVYLDMIQDNLFLGVGHSVGARIGEQFGGTNHTNTHNGFLEVILGTGIAGASVFLIWLISHCFYVIKNKVLEYPIGVATTAALLTLLANNMSKSIIGGAFDPVALVFLLILGISYNHFKGKLRDESINCSQ